MLTFKEVLPVFQSTLSVRRATVPDAETLRTPNISIHALREESDYVGKAVLVLDWISIHALREESDPTSAKSESTTTDFNPRSP